MADFKIEFPKNKQTANLTSYGVFVASGRAKQEVTELSGECWIAGSDRKFPGGNVILVPYPKGKHGDDKKRWSMMFKVEGFDGKGVKDCHLVVKGKAGAKELPPEEVDFRITQSLRDFITITWPETNDDISADAEYFAPYGELNEGSLSSVTMQSTATPPHNVGIIFEYGESHTYFCWVAQFDTVPPVSPPVTYTLKAVAVNNSGATSTAKSTGLHF